MTTLAHIPQDVDVNKIMSEVEEKINGNKHKINSAKTIQKKTIISNEAIFWQELINAELQIADYILFGKLEEHNNRIIEEAEKIGVFKTFSKIRGKFQQNSKLVKGLRQRCLLSERTEFIHLIGAGNFNHYKKPYSLEGSTFLMTVQYKWSQFTKEYYTKLYYAIRLAILKAKYEHTDLCSVIYLTYCTCKILKAVAEDARDRLFKQTGIKCKSCSVDLFDAYFKNLDEIANEYIGAETKFTDYDKRQIQIGCQAIYNSLSNSRGGKVIDDCLYAATEDYANYCIARMLLDTRQQGHISQIDYEEIRRMNFTPKQAGLFQKELKKMTFAMEETDPYELKELVRYVSYAPIAFKIKKTILSHT